MRTAVFLRGASATGARCRPASHLAPPPCCTARFISTTTTTTTQTRRGSDKTMHTAQRCRRLTAAVSAAAALPQQHRRFFSHYHHHQRSAAADASSSSSSESPSPQKKTTTTTPTHYDLFPTTLPLGAPPRGHFRIDPAALRREFLALQARAHPDVHPAGAARSRAEAHSALINEAYRTLASPLSRAQYLLSLRGVDLVGDEHLRVYLDDEEEQGTSSSSSPPPLLTTVLEIREAIEEAADEAAVERIRAVNDQRIADGEEALERAFCDDDVEAARKEAVRMRYWVNIRESLDNWEPERPISLQH